MTFDENLVKGILTEIRREHTISPKIPDENLVDYIKEGMYDINNYVGCMIKYEDDLKARTLLKNYVLYAEYKRLAEFKELYMRDYNELQAQYNRDTSV